LTGAAARNDLKLANFTLRVTVRAANAGALAIPPDLAGDFSKRIPGGFVGQKIDGKRVLGADGFACPVDADGPLVDGARGPVIIRARLPEMALQETLCLALKIEPGLDTKPRHLPGGRRPDTVKLPDRQRLDKGRPHFRCNDEKPVRLAVIGGEFGEELVVGDAG
jgi:hypothetical protein